MKKAAFNKKFDWSRLSTLFVLIGMCVILAFTSKVFLTVGNVVNVLQQISINAIIAIGMTFVIITAGIDLSVGSVLALSSTTMGVVYVSTGSVFLSILTCLLVGIICGIINGIIITKGGLPPFISTLGMMNMARGIALTLTAGKTINGFNGTFRWIGTKTITGAGFPVQVIFMLILMAAAFYILRYRKLGRYIYAIGGNEEVTRLTGINVYRYKIIAYAISGLTAAIAGYVLTAKLNAAQPISGDGYELDAIAACVIGGVSQEGGVGSVWGTLIGAIIVGVINNGMTLLNVSSYFQEFVIGLVIVISVLIDVQKNRKTR
ncbi:ABC transporter permease [Ruminococcus gauvreauii]|uniref:Ribose ABC transporter permease n=1 Tax=Ruminococcus gauvreauii TaxID=438033 RepID=A0ABY5VK53_9FIRM|nr:hypothetical protein [Ruminococcus gauvreauii]UWP60767.1 ribose ABC transporter permease [Ruminococcus gauvreauii]